MGTSICKSHIISVHIFSILKIVKIFISYIRQNNTMLSFSSSLKICGVLKCESIYKVVQI